jgi:hypothetical protein
MHEAILPLQKEFGTLIRELLGEKASDEEVQLCQMSILGQCMHPMMHHRHRHRFSGKLPVPPLPMPAIPDIDVVADHIVRFSLAGIREIQQRHLKKRR